MPVRELLEQGDLDAALEAAKEDVRANPAALDPRVLLFQLMCVVGDWERAMTQLNVAAELDPIALAMAQTYRQALNGEAFRARVFAGERTPLVLGEPPEWIGPLLESLRVGASGDGAGAATLRAKAFESAPATSGSLDGQAFEWISDADQRFGPALEAYVNGKYYWIPFEHIRDVAIEAPSDLRDLAWAPGHFTWINGGEAVGLVPTRYPGAESDADPAVKLARKTEWDDLGNELFVGRGQRILATDVEEKPLLEIRHIEITPAAEPDDA